MPEPIRKIRKRKIPARVIGGVLAFAVLAGITWFAWSSLERDAGANSNRIDEGHITRAVFCAAEECVGVDDAGVAFMSSLRPRGTLILLLEDHTRHTPPDIGERLISPELMHELETFRALTSDELALRLEKVEIYDIHYEDFEFTTHEGWVLKISIITRPEITVEILHHVLNELGATRNTLEYIDLRIPSRVYFKMQE